MNVNQIVRIIPTLKVNNRKLNETFYMETLGMKVLLEESAFLSLGDQTGLEKLVLEEAPSMRTRKVEGRKKLARLIIKVENPLEVEDSYLKQIRFINYIKVKMATLLKFFHQKMI